MASGRSRLSGGELLCLVATTVSCTPLLNVDPFGNSGITFKHDLSAILTLNRGARAARVLYTSLRGSSGEKKVA